MSSDLRAGERLTINKEFESFDAFIQEYVTNISRTGVFIRAQEPLAVGTKVNLRFTVIMDDIETIDGIGEVVRVERTAWVWCFASSLATRRTSSTSSSSGAREIRAVGNFFRSSATLVCS